MIRARRTSRWVEVDRFNTRRSSACCSTETIRGRTFRAMLQGYQVTPVLNSYLRDITLDDLSEFPHEVVGGSYHLFPFPADALSAVVLGARANDQTETRIRAALAASDVATVPLFRARTSDTKFAIMVSPA